MVRRLRPLSEVECYLRCYGGGDENVRLVEPRPVRRRIRATVSGEQLRRLFEERLTTRSPEAEAA